MLLTFILIITCLHQITVSVETVMTTPQLETATVTRELGLGQKTATMTQELELGPQIPTTTREREQGLEIATMTRELGQGPETATMTLELVPQIPTTTRMIPAMNCHEVCTVLIDVIKSMVTVRSVSKCHE